MAIEILNHCKNEAYKGLVYKEDFEKAFDNIDWKFLMNLLAARDIGTRWNHWVQDIVCTAKASVLVNDEKENAFKLKKGLRQGDPLSPQLLYTDGG